VNPVSRPPGITESSWTRRRDRSYALVARARKAPLPAVFGCRAVSTPGGHEPPETASVDSRQSRCHGSRILPGVSRVSRRSSRAAVRPLGGELRRRQHAGPRCSSQRFSRR